MPLIPPQTDPVEPRTEPEVGEGVPRTPPPPHSTLPDADVAVVSAAPAQDAPVTFVPHEASGALATPPPTLIPAGRYGVLETHELVRLLSSLDDERARSRFRESVYLSIFFWIFVVLVILYGPHYLWHAPKLMLPSDVLKQREMTQLNAPILRHAPPSPKPSPKPALDNHTLEKLREMTKRAPAPQPAPTPSPAPTPVTPSPTVPQPTPHAPLPSHAPPVVAEAPLPQPTAKSQPNFSNPGSTIGNLSAVPRGGGASSGDIATPRGANVGGGMEILSDTQGVDFSAYLRRMHRDTMNAWLPLLPEETEAPLLKAGQTNIIITILPDGTIGDMKLESSTRDMAIDKAAWGSIVSQGKLQPLPSQFHGPNLILRLMYSINERNR